MEAFMMELFEQLGQGLDSVKADINAVRGYNLKTELVEVAIRKAKAYLHLHPLSDKDTEILYYKHWAPRFFKLQIIYTLYYNLERSRITIADEESFEDCLRKESGRLQEFLKHHVDLWMYYLLAETNRDGELFIGAYPSKTEDFLTADTFYCKSSILLAKIMAYEEFLPVIEKELNMSEIGTEVSGTGNSQDVGAYKWTGTKAQATEVIYALVKMKCVAVGERDVEIKDMVLFFKEVLGFEIDNIYDVELHNKMRKKEKAPFLNAMLGVYLAADK